MACECYRIGGPFIAEDPDCPFHGVDAQAEKKRLEQQETEKDQRISQLEERVTQLEHVVRQLQQHGQSRA